jgi:hypothetical protein
MSGAEQYVDPRQPERPEREDRDARLSTAELAEGEAASTREVAQERRSFDQAGGKAAPLLAEREVSELRDYWTSIQAGFVDEPRRAVEDADALVAQTMKRLAEMFANERASLESQWDRGDKVSTEELRVALQRYRSFFDRLLSV